MSAIRKCPYCMGDKIEKELHTDCYSSWVVITCSNCQAFAECGVDEDPTLPYPNPLKNWKRKALAYWNSPDATIFKKILLRRNRC